MQLGQHDAHMWTFHTFLTYAQYASVAVWAADRRARMGKVANYTDAERLMCKAYGLEY